MDLSWFNSLLYGLVTGLTEILPVSSRAHSELILKLLGQEESALCTMMIHLGVALGLYRASAASISKMTRALALARIPKRKRTRPLDTKSLMDFRLLRSTAIPAVILYIFYGKIHAMDSSLLLVAVFSLLNGILLYIPQFLPKGNKDCRNMSRVEGYIIGLGHGLSVFPGISGIGAASSVASICGVEKQYSMNLVLLTELAVMACMIVHDFLGMISVGLGILSIALILKSLLAAAAAFGGTVLGIRLMRRLFADSGLQIFSYYCWGLAFLVFFLNLMA